MLNKFILTLTLSFLSCSVTAAQAGPQGTAPSWRTFTPEGKAFSVELPGVPRHRADKISKPGVSAEFDTYQLATNSEVYFFGEMGIPPSESTPDERLEFGISKAVAGVLARGGKEISKRKITSSFGCPGVLWVGSEPGIPKWEVRAFATPEMLFVLIYASRETGQASDNNASRFFDSLKVPGSPCEKKKTE
jgi:hypothetical protein